MIQIGTYNKHKRTVENLENGRTVHYLIFLDAQKNPIGFYFQKFILIESFGRAWALVRETSYIYLATGNETPIGKALMNVQEVVCCDTSSEFWEYFQSLGINSKISFF